MTERGKMLILPPISFSKKRDWFECTQCHEVTYQDRHSVETAVPSEIPCGHEKAVRAINKQEAFLKLRKHYSHIVEEK